MQQYYPAIAVEIGRPNHTLYIQNINEKAKITLLKQSLNSLFSKHGRILDIIAKKQVRLRGQAFVVFENEGCAVRALQANQGRILYEKPMVIKFAKHKSDLIAKLDGTLAEEKKRREAERAEKGLRLTKKEEMMQEMINNPNVPFVPKGSEFIVPNVTLFVENLPEGMQKSALEELFRQYTGFVEVRTVPGRSDIAFVEYENEYQSNLAKIGLDNFKAKENNIKVTFAKK